MTELAVNLQQILVVDDDPEISEMIGHGLTIAGFQIEKASDGRDAMRVLRKHPDIRLVVSDIRMPIMSGVELLELLKKNRPDMPIILISGDSRFLSEGHILSGIAKVIPKPMSMEKLIQTVRETLKKIED